MQASEQTRLARRRGRHEEIRAQVRHPAPVESPSASRQLEADTPADLVVVNGDSLTDVRVLRDHALLTVMKNGTLDRRRRSDRSVVSSIAGLGRTSQCTVLVA
jgi:hypothetical protein